jgi:hypothetical protein
MIRWVGFQPAYEAKQTRFPKFEKRVLELVHKRAVNAS